MVLCRQTQDHFGWALSRSHGLALDQKQYNLLRRQVYELWLACGWSKAWIEQSAILGGRNFACMTWGNTCAHLQTPQPPSKWTLSVLTAPWTFLSAAEMFHQELKVCTWKNMGYFSVKVKESLQCNEERQGKINRDLFLINVLPISLGSRDLEASGQEALSVLQWSWLYSQLSGMALPFMEQILHPGEKPQTTFTLSLQQFLQNSLPMLTYICIFHQGEEGVWDVPRWAHQWAAKDRGESIKSLELLEKNTVY